MSQKKKWYGKTLIKCLENVLKTPTFLSNVSKVIIKMRYCPPNITIHDIWIHHGVSTCFLETVTSSIVGLFILIFGIIQLVFYRRFATRIEHLPFNKLYSLQVFSHMFLILIAGLDILLRKTLFQREVYGFEILYVCASFVTWPMVLVVLIVERCYQLRE